MELRDTHEGILCLASFVFVKVTQLEMDISDPDNGHACTHIDEELTYLALLDYRIYRGLSTTGV